jgi:hypothetical protein
MNMVRLNLASMHLDAEVGLGPAFVTISKRCGLVAFCFEALPLLPELTRPPFYPGLPKFSASAIYRGPA